MKKPDVFVLGTGTWIISKLKGKVSNRHSRIPIVQSIDSFSLRLWITIFESLVSCLTPDLILDIVFGHSTEGCGQYLELDRS